MLAKLWAPVAAVLLGAIKAVGSHVTPGHRGRARRWLDSTDLA